MESNNAINDNNNAATLSNIDDLHTQELWQYCVNLLGTKQHHARWLMCYFRTFPEYYQQTSQSCNNNNNNNVNRENQYKTILLSPLQYRLICEWATEHGHFGLINWIVSMLCDKGIGYTGADNYLWTTQLPLRALIYKQTHLIPLLHWKYPQLYLCSTDALHTLYDKIKQPLLSLLQNKPSIVSNIHALHSRVKCARLSFAQCHPPNVATCSDCGRAQMQFDIHEMCEAAAAMGNVSEVAWLINNNIYHYSLCRLCNIGIWYNHLHIVQWCVAKAKEWGMLYVLQNCIQMAIQYKRTDIVAWWCKDRLHTLFQSPLLCLVSKQKSRDISYIYP